MVKQRLGKMLNANVQVDMREESAASDLLKKKQSDNTIKQEDRRQSKQIVSKTLKPSELKGNWHLPNIHKASLPKSLKLSKEKENEL